MFSKLSISVAAALALSAATGAVADPASIPTSSDEARARPYSATNVEIGALETGNPDSIDYRNRAVARHSPTNDEIDAAETGNPDSVGYRNRAVARHSPTNDEIDAAETGNPDSPDNKDQQSRPADVNRQAALVSGSRAK